MDNEEMARHIWRAFHARNTSDAFDEGWNSALRRVATFLTVDLKDEEPN